MRLTTIRDLAAALFVQFAVFVLMVLMFVFVIPVVLIGVTLTGSSDGGVIGVYLRAADGSLTKVLGWLDPLRELVRRTPWCSRIVVSAWPLNEPAKMWLEQHPRRYQVWTTDPDTGQREELLRMSDDLEDAKSFAASLDSRLPVHVRVYELGGNDSVAGPWVYRGR